MAHSVSARKRIRQNEKRRLRNQGVLSELKTRTKRLAAVVAQKDAGKAEDLFRTTVSRIDKAAKNKIIHRNLASRWKAKLSRLLQALSAPAAEKTA